MKQLLTNKAGVEVVNESAASVIASKIFSRGNEEKHDAFFVGDMGDVVLKHKLWTSMLPRVEPFYAVKCNDDPAILAVLAQLGTGFDCASKGELGKILELKVPQSRIIYANPCKQSSHIKYAAKHDVTLMTFDNETELHKIKAVHPGAKMVVRILPPANNKCQCELGMKFGCQPKNVVHLLRVARELEVDVVGVSFHVGSGCYDATAYSAAVASARTVFDIAEAEGFHFNLLDVGGGFPGQKSAKLPFEQICEVLKPALDLYFPENTDVRIIAEPGRFFVASAFTLAVNVIARRAIARDDAGNDAGESELSSDAEPTYMYYVNDGVYGSFNCILFDHAELETPYVEPARDHGEPKFQCSLWGPTCDGLDCISKECLLPKLNTGDWLVFKDMGAYTMSAASCFNGMPKSKCYYIMQECSWEQLCNSGHMTLDSAAHHSIPMKTGLDTLEHDLVPAIQECLIQNVEN